MNTTELADKIDELKIIGLELKVHPRKGIIRIETESILELSEIVELLDLIEQSSFDCDIYGINNVLIINISES